MENVNSPIKYNPAVMPIKPLGRPDTKIDSGAGRTAESFSAILDEQIKEVKFSRHASERLKQRGIDFDEVMQKKLEQAVDKASSKGSREALVLDNENQLAMLVSVKNRTVITAVDGSNIKDNVFTNIDSAVIV